MTQKIPVQFELEIDAPKGEAWEFVEAEYKGPTTTFRTADRSSGDTYLHYRIHCRRVEPLETECEWVWVNDEFLALQNGDEYELIRIYKEARHE